MIKTQTQKTFKRANHGPTAMMQGEKANDFKGTIKRLIKHLNKYKFSMIVSFIFAGLSTVFSIIGPEILGKATTKLFDGIIKKILGTGNIDFDYIGKIILTLLFLYIISSLLSYIQSFIMTNVSMKVSYNFRREISQKINRMPFRYFDNNNNGEVLSRITNDVDTLSQTLNQSLSQMITSIVTLIGILIMMFTISWQMTLVALCIIPLSAFFTLFVVKKSQKYFKQRQDFLGNMNGHIEEMYFSHIIVKAFNGEEKSIKKFDNINEKLYKSTWKSQFFTSVMRPIMNFIGNLGYVFVCILGGTLVIKKTIQIGDVQAFMQYIRQFNQPINQIANISNVLQQTAASAERIFEFLDEDEEVIDTQNPVKLNKIQGLIEFKNVHFGYNENKIIINDFSAFIKPGQKIAIVGLTGAGKTTIIKLLMRFYDVNSGGIFIDGNNIKDFTRHDLRSMFGIVLQDTWLYNSTIMENIRYGNLDASDEEVMKAAKAAHVDSFVNTLSGGYNMIINEDISNISEGQKQLITIARAILSNPKILILDEATSSIDTRTEIQVQNAMNNLMKNKTSFIIAHRLSTIKDADLILVMENGDIVEKGTHDELIKNGHVYKELYSSQFNFE